MSKFQLLHARLSMKKFYNHGFQVWKCYMHSALNSQYGIRSNNVRLGSNGWLLCVTAENNPFKTDANHGDHLIFVMGMEG